MGGGGVSHVSLRVRIGTDLHMAMLLERVRWWKIVFPSLSVLSRSGFGFPVVSPSRNLQNSAKAQ